MLFPKVLPTVALVIGADALAIQHEARATWVAAGCYSDNVSGRALPNEEFLAAGSGAMTNEACQSACASAGYSIAGTEYGGECCK